MNSYDFTELQILIAKLKIVARKTASQDSHFAKYHASSMALLETIPQHLTSLQQGISITNLPENSFQEEENQPQHLQVEQFEPIA